MVAPRYIWMNGSIVPFDEARIHVLTPAVKYGATVFEGICGYWNAGERSLQVFRLPEHLQRLEESVRIDRISAPYAAADCTDVVVRTLQANGFSEDVHIRLSIWVDGGGTMDSSGPAAMMCAALPRAERTLASRAAKACVSSWRRIDDTSMPPRVKTAANYQNGRLGQMQAKADGYDEALFLNSAGTIAEGAGACLFAVRRGELLTPAVTDGILESVTRATLIELAREMGISVVERPIDRTELYVSDEAFLCGSGYEITPLLSIDRHALGKGGVGAVTLALWTRYEAVVRGLSPDHAAWRLRVPPDLAIGIAAQ